MHVLEIYVAPDCLGCETAMRLAESVRTRVIPAVDVHLIDLSAPDAERPDAVFAVPTYLLDGKVLSLGNPDEDWLITRLTASSNGHGPERLLDGGGWS